MYMYMQCTCGFELGASFEVDAKLPVAHRETSNLLLGKKGLGVVPGHVRSDTTGSLVANISLA